MKEKNSSITRLAEVLEWLYVHDGACKTKNEWREELVAQLYYLADIAYPSNGFEIQGEQEIQIVE